MQVRKHTPVYRGIDAGDCEAWCIAALAVLRLEGHHRFQHRATSCERAPILDKNALRFHCWLEQKVGGNLYIADGTAGQFIPSLRAGFYGPLQSAPEALQELYRHGEPAQGLLQRVFEEPVHPMLRPAQREEDAARSRAIARAARASYRAELTIRR